MKFAEHPTVKRLSERQATTRAEDRQPLDADWLRQLVLDAGADDVGFVEIDRKALAELAVNEQAAFAELVQIAKARLAA